MADPPAGNSAERTALRGCWELACVLNFLHTFRGELALEDSVRAEELEDALLQSGSTQPLLHQLHLALLQGMHPRSSIRSWRVTLAEKLQHTWTELGDGACPFAAPAADAERVYDQLSAVARVRALRALCELRLDARADLRDAVDGEGEEPRDEEVDYHGAAALGQDNRGARYYFQDVESGPRLYRERSRRSEEEYTQPGPVLLETWELVATTGEAVLTLSEQLRADKFPGSKNVKLCAQLDKIAERVTEQVKKEEARRARVARQKAELEFSNIVWDEGRTRRARQPVSYTSEAYDAQFAAVLRGRCGRPPEEQQPPRWDVRRGRSGGQAEGDIWADPPDIRGRGRGGHSAGEDASDGSSDGSSDEGDAWGERSESADE